jgi:GNAT superfamily N-acetyltransferase
MIQCVIIGQIPRGITRVVNAELISAVMHIRDAEERDSADIGRLLKELGYETPADVVPSRLAAVRAANGAAFLAVDDDGSALGFIALTAFPVMHASGPVALITALVVAPEGRGHGSGRALVERAKSWAAERRCVRLIVTSGEQRADAQAFYPACGLPFTGRRFSVNIDAR